MLGNLYLWWFSLVHVLVILFPTDYAVPLNQYILDHEILHVHANHTELSGSKLVARVSFRAYGKNFDLQLKSDPHLFHPNFKATAISRTGSYKITGFDTRQYVKGHAGVMGSFVGGRMIGTRFSGIVVMDNDTYHVAQLENYLSPEDYPDHNTIMYLASDVRYPVDGLRSCSSDFPRLQRLQKVNGMNAGLFLRKKRQFNPDRNTCIIHVVADHEFFGGPGNKAEASSLEQMADHIQSVNAIYRDTAFSNNINNVGVSIYAATVFTDDGPENPLVGSYSVEELLDVFSSSAMDFSSVCLAHLFTYRDFQGTIGLAWVADPTGRYAGGICELGSNNPGGLTNLNTGLTSFLNFGRQLLIGVSVVTVAHEIGHNFGSPHDTTAECIPSSGGNYIMYPSATDGSQPNNRKFSPCSREIMGRTIQAKGFCFVEEPSLMECGNGIVEGSEECDCGSNDAVECAEVDPCCVPGNCTLKEGVVCSPGASSCCTMECVPHASTRVCFDSDNDCTKSQNCTGVSPECPAIQFENGTFCDNYTSTCINGSCIGSVCPKYGAPDCMCEDAAKRCDRCCIFNGTCQSLVTLNQENPALYNISYLAAGSACDNYTGYCNEQHECIKVDNTDILDSLRDIFSNLSLKSIGEWLGDNWYIAVAVVIGSILLVILLQVTYRRKKPTNTQTLTESVPLLHRNQ